MSRPPRGRNASLIRVLRIVNLLIVRRWTVAELAAVLGVTTRTIWRDLGVIEEAGLALHRSATPGPPFVPTAFWISRHPPFPLP